MIKSAVLALATTAAALCAAPAHAGGVSWSIGINTPPVSTVISNGSGYYGHGYRGGYGRGYGPGYGRVYAPAPVYHAPAPVYRVPPRVAYYPPAVVYRPVPVVYPRYYPGWRHGHGRR